MTAMLEAVDVSDNSARTVDQLTTRTESGPAGANCQVPGSMETELAGFQGCGDQLAHRK